MNNIDEMENMDVSEIKVEKELNIVFMGTPSFATPILQTLLDNYNVRAVVTQPDKPVGRSGEVVPSAVKKLALEHNLLVLQPKNMKAEYKEVLALEPDIIITCAYGQILPQELLAYPRYGCINVHASLLPKLRGGAPIHRAIMNGYNKTGITIMYMNEGLDSGDIIAQEEVIIEDNDTASTLHNKLKVIGGPLLLKVLPNIFNDTVNRIKQNDDEATFASNIKPEDEKINFERSKREIYNQIRGLNGWPGAYCFIGGKRLKIWSAYVTDNVFPEKLYGEVTELYKDGFGIKVGNGEIVVTEVQLEGKARMKAINFLNGIDKNSFVGKVLG